MEANMINLGVVNQDEIRSEKEVHTPSTIQADTLFTFSSKFEHLFHPLKSRLIAPRYCTEDLSYLEIPEYKKMAFPMKCFCDINMHRLDVHLEWYGCYGLAFSKEWGMRNKIQPVQYINPSSNLRSDFTTAFLSLLKILQEESSPEQDDLANFLLNELMHYKPYDGEMSNRTTGETKVKCFTDECEWRFIPDVSGLGYQQAIINQDLLSFGKLDSLSDSLIGVEETSLKYEYSDLKYIIIKSQEDFVLLTDEINSWGLDKAIEQLLISKIIIWDNSRRDF